MKKRYEKSEKLIVVFFVFLITIISYIAFIFNKKIVLYDVFNGVVYKDNVLALVLSNSQLKLFQQNKVLFIKNNKKKYSIKKIEKEVLERDGEIYNQVYIKVNISDMYKVNDVIDISIMNKSIRSYNIFKIIWEGDLD